MSSNNLPLKPSRGRKSGQIKKTPRRGMGVAQLELLRQQELWAPHFSSAAAANHPVLVSPPLHNFPDRRRLLPLPPVPIFPGPLGHLTGAVSESYCCSVCFKVAAVCFKIGGQEEILAILEKSGCVGKNRVNNVLTRYEFFPEKMIDHHHDAIPQVNAASDHRSNITIDLSLRL